VHSWCGFAMLQEGTKPSGGRFMLQKTGVRGLSTSSNGLQTYTSTIELPSDPRCAATGSVQS
jgi:hypothetical protein